ncbi:MAG: hypothetical protein KC594_08695 [Nitrospira sp.]|nr:hypothetical protein [Nitrospira sp.]
MANTALVDSITTEVEDKRIEFIKSAVKLVGTAIGVSPDAASASAPLQAPAIHDLQPLLDLNGHDKRIIEIADGLEMEIDAVPIDSIAVKDLSSADLSRQFVYSACRPAILKVTADGKETLMRLTVADSRFVQTVAFPLKGKIVSHSQCGASVLPEKVSVSSDIDVAQTALEEILKLREAIDDKSAPDET